MSRPAKLAAWTTAAAVLGAWSWHLGRFNGLQLLVILALLGAAAVLAVRASRREPPPTDFDRVADPAPLHTDWLKP